MFILEFTLPSVSSNPTSRTKTARTDETAEVIDGVLAKLKAERSSNPDQPATVTRDSYKSGDPVDKLKLLLRSGATPDSDVVEIFLLEHGLSRGDIDIKNIFDSHHKDYLALKEALAEGLSLNSGYIKEHILRAGTEEETTLSAKDLEKINTYASEMIAEKEGHFGSTIAPFIPLYSHYSTYNALSRDYKHMQSLPQGSKARKDAQKDFALRSTCDTVGMIAGLGISNPGEGMYRIFKGGFFGLFK